MTRGDRQIESLGKFEVALVVAGNSHDDAGAVAGDDIVGSPDRHAGAGDRMDGEGTGEDAGFFADSRHAFDVGDFAGLVAVGGDGFRLASVVSRSQSSLSGATTT